MGTSPKPADDAPGFVKAPLEHAPTTLKDTSSDAPRVELAAVWTTALAGLLAGAASAGLFSVVDGQVMMPDHLSAVDMYSPADLQKERAAEELRIGNLKTLIFGATFGGLAALLIGVASTRTGAAGSRPSWARVAGSTVIAALLGAAGSRIGQSLAEHWGSGVSEQLWKEAAMRGVMFVLVAVGIGLAFGRSLKERFQAVAYSVIGAGLASMLCPVVASFAFPHSNSERLIMTDIVANGSVLAVAAAAVGGFVAVYRNQQPASA